MWPGISLSSLQPLGCIRRWERELIGTPSLKHESVEGVQCTSKPGSPNQLPGPASGVHQSQRLWCTPETGSGSQEISTFSRGGFETLDTNVLPRLGAWISWLACCLPPVCAIWCNWDLIPGSKNLPFGGEGEGRRKSGYGILMNRSICQLVKNLPATKMMLF